MTAEARRKNLRPRILLAPCGFKESLSVAELIESMARGVRAAAPDAEILCAPMADGGEGFVQTLVQLTGGRLRPVQVTGPVGQPLEAHLGLFGGVHVGTVAIEIAAAGVLLGLRCCRDHEGGARRCNCPGPCKHADCGP